jgi:tetratricopeptide (TPR) repeat protein
MTLLGHPPCAACGRALVAKRVLRTRTISGLLLWLIVVASLLLGTGSAFALPVAWLKNVQPTVEVRTSARAKWQTARERHRLHFGHYVRTVSSGKTQILFSNGTQLLLSSGTQVELVAPAKDNQPLIVRVFGSLSEVFVKAKGNTQIRTAAGTAAVRGTQYLVRVVKDTSTEVTVTEGAVQFYNGRGSVLLTANQQSNATVESAPTPPRTVDPSGLVEWTADISGFPVEFEMPFSRLSRDASQNRLRAGANVVQLNPNDAAAHAALGETLYDAGEYSQAAEQFGHAVRLQPDNAAWHTRLGRARHGQGNLPAARQAFERARELAPADVAPRIGLALVMLSAGDEVAASAVLEGADHPTGGAVLGLISLRQGRINDAIQQLQAAINGEPQLYQAHALLALAFLSQNQLKEAEAAALHAVRAAPHSAQAQGALAMALFFRGRTDEATRVATHAVRLNPLSPFALLTQGRALLARQQTDEARDALLRAQVLAPDLPLIDTELGAVYLRLDMPQQAEAAYRRAVERNAKLAEAHSGLAVALQQQGKKSDALAMHQRALQLTPNSSTVRGNLASFYIEQGDLTAAGEQLEKGVLAAPERGILYVRLAELALYQQNVRAAEDYARQAVRLLPRSALARYQLGRVYLEQDRVFQAEQQFLQAVILEPQFAEALYALGLTRSRTQSDLRGLSLSARSAFVGSSGTARSLQNLTSAGAPERIQGLSQDPAVPRVASRSYGDTEVNGRIGQDGSHDLEISHLKSTQGNRGVVGITIARNEEDGVRANADYTRNELDIIIGQKRQNSPSGFFALGQIERTELGQNRAFKPNEFARNLRYRSGQSRVVAGYNFSHGADSRTRVLTQISEPYALQTDISDPDFYSDFNFRRVHVEARHDRRFGQRHWFTAGFFSGVHQREIRDRLDDFRLRLDGELRVIGAYVRDEVIINDRLKVIGDMQVQHIDLAGLSRVSPPLFDPYRVKRDSATLLPTLVLAYQPQERTGIRLRLRRLAGTVADFQLLRPTDVFRELGDLPGLSSFPNAGRNASGRSAELEIDHTFRNTSFLRLSLFDQDLERAENGSASIPLYGRVEQRGVRLSYEGALSDNTSFFMRLSLNAARDRKGGDIAMVPLYGAGFGLHYLNRAGYFVEPLLLFQGKRLERKPSNDSALDKSDNPQYLDSFSVLNLRVGKRWGLRSTAFVELNNALNAKYSILRERQPQRQIRVGALLRF